MNNIHFYLQGKKLTLLFLFCALSVLSQAQSLTTIRGTIKDAFTNEKLPFATIAFKGTSIGTFSDEEGQFKLSNNQNITTVTISLLGYKTQTITISAKQTTTKEIRLESEDKQLNEVVVRPQKEKYSKKNNPAVELIKKVIAHKKENNITAENHYQYKEYERILFALNDFKPEQPQFKRYKFVSNYVDTSIIDNKAILPFSIREKLSDVYYRKDPKTDKRMVKGYKIEGIDQAIETEGLDAIIKEVFKDVSIFDNSITLLLHEFIGPLSEQSAVNFYRWYLADTVTIDQDRYVKLDFAPFNSRDVGFTGNLYISLDSMYAVKKAVIRTPKKMNINFVDELVIHHEFRKTEDNRWVPVEERMAIDLSLLEAVKFYVDKSRTYNDLVLNKPMDAIYLLDAPEVFEKDYLKRDKTYWASSRPVEQGKDYRMDKMMEDVNKVFIFKVLLNAGKIISSGYVPTSKIPELNKLDIGTLPTLYSYNATEGNRFRLTGTTTNNLHPHLFLYGYGAYGTRDNKFKYYGEATWAFNKIEKHKDEYPKSNLTVAYKYDMNNLGQRFTQAERDNILMSIRSSNNEKLTYNRQSLISYEKEYYGGFTFKLLAQTFDERAAGSLRFEKADAAGNVSPVNSIRTSEATLSMRYAPNEKFFQQRRKRYSIPSPKFVMNLAHTVALNDFFGGQYDYNKTSFSVNKQFWIAPYGKIMVNAQAEKVWGKAPFPLLITPSANNSFTIQKGNFYMIEPLEFIHDKQVSWEIYYHMGGWLFNRVPFLKVLKLREIVGFRGLYGALREENNPKFNHDQLLFPNRSFTTRDRVPYMEYNIGIENILKLFRVDYVRRINYLGHPNVDKDGFRLSFDLNF